MAALQVCHTATDAWETIATDPVPTAMLASACAAYNGKLDVFGGIDAASAYRDLTYIYDPAAAAGSRWRAGAGWAGAYLTDAEHAAFVVPVELMSFSVE